MYLNLSELEPFLVLAAELHFRKASERLFISQPALSKSIRKLEHKVGGPLFLRTRRKVALTESGRVLLPLAEKLLRESKSALELAKQSTEGRAGSLRIGFGIASVSEIIPRTILRFRRAYPSIELHMRDMSTPSQLSGLLDGKIDIGIIRMPINDPRLEATPLFRERLVAAVPRALHFDHRKGLASLRDRPFIMYPRSVSVTFHDHFLALCRSAGFTPHVVQEAGELFTILNLVRAGLGVSLVPYSAVCMHVPGVRLHDLRTTEAEWSIGIAWNKRSDKHVMIARFSEIITEIVKTPPSHRVTQKRQSRRGGGPAR
jgi:DNA-binding transcriptional LysR family regulator